MTIMSVVGSAIQPFLLLLFFYILYKILPFFFETFGNIMAIADTALKEFDKNGDGAISKDEFEMFKNKYFYDSEKWQEWLDKKFTRFDSDKDGKLNASEFKSLINRILTKLDEQSSTSLNPIEEMKEAVLGDTVAELLRGIGYEDTVMERLMEGTAEYKLSNPTFKTPVGLSCDELNCNNKVMHKSKYCYKHRELSKKS